MSHELQLNELVNIWLWFDPLHILVNSIVGITFGQDLLIGIVHNLEKVLYSVLLLKCLKNFQQSFINFIEVDML